MRILRHDRLAAADRGAVVAIGNFDGIHKGHQAVIGAAAPLARSLGAAHAVLTFEPHPRQVFRPQDAPFRLTPFRAKTRAIAALGVDLLLTWHFDLAFAKKSAELFVDELLLGAIGLAHIVVGHDCTFGNRRRGTPEMLRLAGERHGFGVSVLEPVRGTDNAVYLSTHIRELLKSGKPRGIGGWKGYGACECA